MHAFPRRRLIRLTAVMLTIFAPLHLFSEDDDNTFAVEQALSVADTLPTSLIAQTPITPVAGPQLTGDDLKAIPETPENERTIARIFIEGNKHIKTSVVRRMLPFTEGEKFDRDKTPELIGRLYSLGYFRQITIETEKVGTDKLNLFVTLEEKKLIERVTFTGNKHMKAKKLREDLNIAHVDTIDEEWVSHSARTIEQKYKEEGYQFAHVDGQLVQSQVHPDRATAAFVITEGPYSKVTRVFFKGNKTLPDWKLAGIIFTRESWIFGFMNKAGQYNEEMFQLDKARLEQFYRDHGYLMAKVTNAQTVFSDNKKSIEVTFTIEEGERFYIRKLAAPGDDIYIEKDLLPQVLLEEGKPYSHTKLIHSIEKMRNLYGDKGYINADVYPQVIPDDIKKQVDITFYVERGNQVKVRRIDITGNDVTRDKVIRRKIDIEEGDMLTSSKMDKSEDAVNSLSFFERGGVNWQMHRITDDLADLEMNVKETKTGQLNFQLTYGSSEGSPKRTPKGRVQIKQSNFMGKGWDVGGQAQLQFARHGSQYFEGHFVNPNIYDSNMLWHVTGYHRKQQYDEWVNTDRIPTIWESGGTTGLGFYLTPIDKALQLNVDVGMEYLAGRDVKALPPHEKNLQPLLDNIFASDPLQWFEATLFKDTRNHMVYPNRGYRLHSSFKLALPGLNSHYAFAKGELEGSYYTRLIGEDNLVLMMHGKAGFVQELDNRSIPYRELFHIGGQTSVRGFKFGEIGPAFNDEDPVGGRFMLQFNSELVFPILPDYSMRGHVFYDAGAGWDGPRDKLLHKGTMTRNDFNLRHSVGFGFNLMSPTPVKIDWGYKLDRNKERGESPSEFHLSMNYAF